MSLTYLHNINLILIRPSHPGNIGASARAMKTMGLSAMSLVDPLYFPSPTANALASKGLDILEHAQVYPDLHAALSTSQCIFGMSALSTRMPGWPELDIRKAAMLAVQQARNGQKVAFLFGTERTGMTNDELKLCHYHVHIPTSSAFSSLNLSQAVQVACYELFMAGQQESTPEPLARILATHLEQEGFYTHLERVGTKIEFLKDPQTEVMMQKLRRLFQRAQLNSNEIKILRGILSNMERKCSS